MEETGFDNIIIRELPGVCHRSGSIHLPLSAVIPGPSSLGRASNGRQPGGRRLMKIVKCMPFIKVDNGIDMFYTLK